MEKTKTSNWKRENVDRLSGLPDDILIHILAFLPTKIYVATSILGRRWRFLWARVPNLDFDDKGFHDDAGASSFPSIVNRVMFLHNRQNINSFRFRQYRVNNYSDYEYEKWINTAIEYNVQELHLSLAYALSPPSSIFNCKTLVSLSLSWLHMPITGTVYLPTLKKLQLSHVDFKSVEFFRHLISGCPVLNELFIDRLPGNNEICISSPTLNRFELEIDYFIMTYFRGNDFGLKLDTPALKYLKFNNCVSEEYYYSFVHCFASFASAKTFHNLTHIDSEADWRFIKILLEKADNLEVLTIRWSCGDKNPTNWFDPKQVPACLVSHLETVRIRGFLCAAQEFKAVRYILKNTKVLKRMEIYTGNIDSNEQLEAVKRITLFERGSDACHLAFH